MFDVLKEGPHYKPRLRPVGRLDKDTQGLLLFTSDGELLHRLTHPEYHVPKVYRVEARDPITSSAIAAMTEGITLQDARSGKPRTARASNITVESETSILMTIHEGIHRQVRRMLTSQGNHVAHLTRISMVSCSALILTDIARFFRAHVGCHTH